MRSRVVEEYQEERRIKAAIIWKEEYFIQEIGEIYRGFVNEMRIDLSLMDMKPWQGMISVWAPFYPMPKLTSFSFSLRGVKGKLVILYLVRLLFQFKPTKTSPAIFGLMALWKIKQHVLTSNKRIIHSEIFLKIILRCYLL